MISFDAFALIFNMVVIAGKYSGPTAWAPREVRNAIHNRQDNGIDFRTTDANVLEQIVGNALQHAALLCDR